MNLRRVKLLAAVFTTAATLSACSGGSCAPNSGGSLALAISAPSQYPAGVAVTAYLTMHNTSNVNGNNLVYSVPTPGNTGNTTGVNITINPNGAGQHCENIPAGAFCTFTANIPAGSTPGSFTVTATPTAPQGAQSAKVNNSMSLQAAGEAISVTANLGLVDVPVTSNQYYVLPNQQTISGSSTSATQAFVSVWVKQVSGGLNKFKLVDDSGSPVTYSVVGSENYSVNSVNTYAVTIPAGKTLQHIQVFGYNGSTPVCNTLNIGTNDSTACSNDADINLAPTGVGILSVQPNYFVMSESYTQQVVTIQNIGKTKISGLSPIESTNIFSESNINCSSTLEAESYCNVLITYNPANAQSNGQGSFVINYNNGQSNVNTAATIPYLKNGSSAVGVLGVSPNSISLSPNNPAQVITLTNNGQGSLTLSGFPSLGTPLESGITTCSANQTLAPQASCNYVLQYSMSADSGSQTVAFNYNNGQSAQITNVAVDWVAKTQYLLMVGGGGSGEGVMSKCTIDSSNALTNCANMTTISLPSGGGFDGMTFEKVDGVYKLFMANPGQFGAIFMCDYDSATGDVSDANCNIVSPDATVTGNPETPRSIVFHTDANGDRYAYIVSISASSSQKARNGIYKCEMSNIGTISNCSQNIAIANMTSENILFDDTPNGTKLYYGYLDGWSAGQSGMNKCDVDANGDIGSCSSANLSIPSYSSYYPYWLEFKYFNNTKYVYINDWANGVFFQCGIDGSGDLTNCANLISTNNYFGHLQFAFNTINDSTMLFLPGDFYGSGLPAPITGQSGNGLLSFSASLDGAVMTFNSVINKNYFVGYGSNGIRSAIVSP